MIIIENKQQASFSVPRNPRYSGGFDLEIFSPVGLWSREYYVVDDFSSKNFYKFQADFWNVPDGEFNYALSQDGESVATGIMQIGSGTSEDYYLQYPFSIEYLQYFPKIDAITVLAPGSLAYGVTELVFTIYSNVPWVYTLYREGAPYGETTHGDSGKSVQSIDIPVNETLQNVWWEIACGDEEGNISVLKRILQFGIPFNVSVSSPSAQIAASATTIPFTVTYNQRNTYRTGNIYLLKDGTRTQQMPLNYYPLSFSSAFTIPQNTEEETVSYEIQAVLPATPNDPEVSASTTVTQAAASVLVMSASSYYLTADDDELTWNWRANTEWKLTTIAPWGEGEGYMPAGSGSPVYVIGQNEEDEPRTIIYRGETLDGAVTRTLTFIQDGVTPDWTKKPLRVEMLEDGDISWNPLREVLYSKNGGEKQVLNGTITGLSAGDYVEFTVSADSTTRTISSIQNSIQSTARHNVCGNVMSLYYVNFKNIRNCVKVSQFNGLMNEDTGLVNAENLILPATALTNYCYQYMFRGCTSLETAPVLPATSLAILCYGEMFNGCTSLETAPALPATTLEGGCYAYMFQGCTGLETAPDLPATTLARWCYANMFKNCSNLNYIKTLATNLSEEYCTGSWTYGVSETGDFWRISSTAWPTGNDGIPEGWTSHNIDR